MLEISTDYLIVGAGAMGMGFLDELVTCSQLEAVIVDTRDKPGGHWNQAYSFVRLHQPALNYGVPSRGLGVGGPDLASRAQVLAHYEQALAAHLATGRVRFLGQCRHVGGGTVVSLLEENLVYKARQLQFVTILTQTAGAQVTYRRKLVDATCCETLVPATSPPAFRVAPGVNFMPINGQ